MHLCPPHDPVMDWKTVPVFRFDRCANCAEEVFDYLGRIFDGSLVLGIVPRASVLEGLHLSCELYSFHECWDRWLFVRKDLEPRHAHGPNHKLQCVRHYRSWLLRLILKHTLACWNTDTAPFSPRWIEMVRPVDGVAPPRRCLSCSRDTII